MRRKRLIKLIAFFILIFGLIILFRSIKDNKKTVLVKQSEGLVKSITTIAEDGGRVDWSHKNDLIAFSKIGNDKYYDVYTMEPDASNQTCLTCNKSSVPQKHNGQPAWHPDGEWIVFQAVDPNLKIPLLLKTKEDNLTQGGVGFHNNLWLVNKDGNTFYQLTHIKQGEATLHPHFSHDGSKLFWAARINESGGMWALKIADFKENPTPHLENEKTYRPLGDVFYESHSFSLDDTKVIFTVGFSGESEMGDMDIYMMDTSTQKLTKLTNSKDVWDEHAILSPSGKKIAWITSTGYNFTPAANWGATLKTEFWLMDADGSDKQQLTHFNQPGYSEYNSDERVICADSSWNKDGTKLVGLVGVTSGSRKYRRIVLIEFNKPQ